LRSVFGFPIPLSALRFPPSDFRIPHLLRLQRSTPNSLCHVERRRDISRFLPSLLILNSAVRLPRSTFRSPVRHRSPFPAPRCAGRSS